MTTQKRGEIYALIFVGLVLVAAGISIFVTDKAAEKQAATEEAEALSNTEPAQNFTMILPSDWKYYKNAGEDIQDLMPNQSIQFGVIQDPTEPSRYYFIADAQSDETTTAHNVYTYDTTNYTFERIYRFSTSIDKDFDGIRSGAFINFHALAYDDGKLVILAEDADDSPGPCTEVLTLGRDSTDRAREMLSIALSDPYHEAMQPYVVPDNVYQEALERQSACVDNM
ncbi:MAG: hypothetical protein QG626_119 [Patescibacteria group bacterium]|nr:hypothetical protein [Patescibacteria group bacterium]